VPAPLRRAMAALAALLALATAAPPPPAGAAGPFPDVPPDAYFAEAVAQLAARGVFRGYPDGTFGPADRLQRAQIAVSLVRAMGWGGESGARDFPDRGDTDPESWAAVRALADKGVLRGFPDGTFRPHAPLTREQAVAIIARAMVARGAWSPGAATAPYGDLSPDHLADVALYVARAGPAPDAAGGLLGAGQIAERGWYAAALWQAARALPAGDTPAPALPPGTLRTFHVAPWGDDGGPGSEARPWRTLRHAAATLVAGDTALVEDGVYREEGPVALDRDGTAAHRVTLRARNPLGATLVAGDRCAPKFSIGGSYVTVEGFHVTQAAPCDEYNSRDAAVYCWPGGVACAARGIRQENMRVGMKTNQDHSLFEGNIVADMIETFNADGAIVRGNTIYLSHDDGITTKGGSRSNQVYNNVVHVVGDADRAIVLGGNSTIFSPECCNYDNAGPEGYNLVAYNNVVVAAGGIVGTALEMSGCRDCAFFNNAVIGANYALYTRRGGVGQPTYAPGNERPIFMNNIVLDCRHGARFEAATDVTVDHNLFHGTPAVPPQARGVAGDPRFADRGGDWRLLPGSPALGAGVAATFTGFHGEAIDIARDRAGRSRRAPWDLGPYAR
jgi:hypothetical protein